MTANFIWFSGTSNNGVLTSSAITLMSTEYVSIGSSGTAVSANTFGSSQTGQGLTGNVYITYGSSQGSTQAAGANIAGWFLTSFDNGTTFESTSPGTANGNSPRPPDFIITLPSTVVATGLTFGSVAVSIPPLKFKVMLQNNTGVTSPTTNSAGAPSIFLAPYAVQY